MLQVSLPYMNTFATLQSSIWSYMVCPTPHQICMDIILRLESWWGKCKSRATYSKTPKENTQVYFKHPIITLHEHICPLHVHICPLITFNLQCMKLYDLSHPPSPQNILDTFSILQLESWWGKCKSHAESYVFQKTLIVKCTHTFKVCLLHEHICHITFIQ